MPSLQHPLFPLFHIIQNVWPCVAGASGSVAWAPQHVTTWSTPRHPHANRPFPINAILADPPCHRNLIISVTTSSLFLFLNRAKPSHLHFLTYLSLYITLPLARSLKKTTLPHQMDGRRSLSTVTEGHEPEANAQGSPSAQLQV